MVLPPPASDMSITFWPCGLTSRMSRSAGKACPRLDNVTLTLVIEPSKPDRKKPEGYGLASLPDGMLIELLVPKLVEAKFVPLLVITNWSASIKPALRT